MRLRFGPKATTLTLAALVIAACGGGGGGGTSNGGGLTADQLANQATAAVNRMLADQDPVNVTNLAAAKQTFGQARNIDPSHRKANAGYTIAGVALEAQKVLDLFGITITRAPSATETPLERRLAAARFGLLSQIAPAIGPEDVSPIGSQGTWNVVSLPASARRQANRPGEYPVDPTYAQVFSTLQSADLTLAEMQVVLENEAALPNDANPYLLVDPRNTATTVKLGTVEMRALRAAVQGLRSAINLLLSYNFDFDVATYPYDQPFTTVFAAKLDGSAIPPASYLPGGSFGQIYPDGRQRLHDFLALSKIAVDSGLSACDAYEARTGTGFAVNPGDVLPADITKFRSDADTVKQYQNGPVQTTVNGFTTTVNVPAWVANPPNNLVLFAPALHAADQGFFVQVRYSGADMPNRAYGGLFSPPLPASAIHNVVNISDRSTTVAKVLGKVLVGTR